MTVDDLTTYAGAMAYAERELDALIDRYLAAIELSLWLDRDEDALDDGTAPQWISISHAMSLERAVMTQWRETTLAVARQKISGLLLTPTTSSNIVTHKEPDHTRT